MFDYDSLKTQFLNQSIDNNEDFDDSTNHNSITSPKDYNEEGTVFSDV